MLALVAVAGLILAFVFSGMEAGVLSLNPIRVRRLARQGNRAARMLSQYVADYERFLLTILVGNTVASLVVFGLLAWGLFKLPLPWPTAVFGVWLPAAGALRAKD